MIEAAAQKLETIRQTYKPRLGFLGVGWIGLNRLQAVAASEFGEITAIVEPNRGMADKAREIAVEAEVCNSLDELLGSGIEGLVIATPSALHADQAIAALERGISVFCQKPLGRTAEETRRVVETARRENCLLAVDFCYRFIDGLDKMRELIRTGRLGRIFAVDLVFHNAYGPDKPWFFDRRLSGGGCVIDLGVHLVDLALWILDFPPTTNVSSRLFAQGHPIQNLDEAVEDFATARVDLAGGTTATLTCSWNLHAGREAEISATFYGTAGGAVLRNLNGSFFDFTVERLSGTSRTHLTSAAEGDRNWNWGGRAITNWTERLAAGEKFDPECEQLVSVATIIDEIYEKSCRSKNCIY